MKQNRTFVLGRDGEMKYYKDKTLYRGSIILCRNTKVIKTGRSTFEIQTPKRTFYLLESESAPNQLDKWIEAIEKVIKTL